ncbi:hypothetical protein BDA96_04G279700 [Sorghum bicolor]|uniref:Uncharacterized protein n=2 Tax=Sorghum bicolor TaxID=4558 RepID=A0A921R5T3_SORBI|nr:hypothetical protein BDA96_04G279700 [Sorghum bicolor]OQU85521.1 hypothetical protein SORBI_3004G262550 [Sorghum bicolor]
MDVETTVSLGRSTVGESILHVKKSVRGGLQPTILCCAERTKKKRFARVNGPMFCLPHAVSCRLNPESMQQPPAPIKNAKKREPQLHKSTQDASLPGRMPGLAVPEHKPSVAPRSSCCEILHNGTPGCGRIVQARRYEEKDTARECTEKTKSRKWKRTRRRGREEDD